MKHSNGILDRIIAWCVSVAAALGTGTVTVSAVGASGGSVKINAANFPDPNFRAVISGADYDRDGNGVLSAKEILLLRNLYCDNRDISSLKGIEYFTELRGLYCMDNRIKTMDLTGNKLLTGIWCSGNLFTELNFTPNPELEWVYCFDCRLTSLDVSNNPKMSYIECNTNPLKQIDVSHNPELEHLMCGSCELTKLDLSKNKKLQHLDAFRNKLKTLDVSCCPKLKRLDIWDNPGLGSIDVSKNPGLQYYNCAHNGAVNVDVSHNPELVKLNCAYNSIKTLDLSNNPKLVYLDCADNKIKKLDLSKNTKLYFLQAFINNFTTLDIGYAPLLIKTYKEGVKEDVYGIASAWTIDYGGDDSTGGDSIYFLSFDDKVKLNTKQKYTASEKTEIIIPDGVSESELIKREVAVQTLYDMAGRPKVTGRSRFKDVEQGAWYENALIWGEKNAICVGTPDISSDTFGVGEWVTRQDLALMMMRYSEYRNYKRSIDFGRADDFIDYYDIDYYAWEAVTWAATWNIMVGKGAPDAPKEERRIEPHTAATRNDYREMLERMMEVNGISETPVIAEDPSGITSAAATPAGTVLEKVTSPGKKQLKVVWKRSADAVTGYEVMIASDKSFSKNKQIFTVTGSSKRRITLSGLKGKTAYYVRVRAFRTVGDTRYYGGWSSIKTAKTR